jgi:hypothetical protein
VSHIVNQPRASILTHRQRDRGRQPSRKKERREDIDAPGDKRGQLRDTGLLNWRHFFFAFLIICTAS